jgi:hypothetical protein
MSIRLVNLAMTHELFPDQPLIYDFLSGAATEFSSRDRLSSSAVVLFTDGKSRALVFTPRKTLYVNGLAVEWFCSLNSDSILRLLIPDSVPASLIFDDRALSVPPGSECSVCGKVLEASGSQHCRRVFCAECVETFGGVCPDCRKSLDASGETDLVPLLVQEILSV